MSDAQTLCGTPSDLNFAPLSGKNLQHQPAAFFIVIYKNSTQNVAFNISVVFPWTEIAF